MGVRFQFRTIYHSADSNISSKLDSDPYLCSVLSDVHILVADKRFMKTFNKKSDLIR